MSDFYNRVNEIQNAVYELRQKWIYDLKQIYNMVSDIIDDNLEDTNKENFREFQNKLKRKIDDWTRPFSLWRSYHIENFTEGLTYPENYIVRGNYAMRVGGYEEYMGYMNEFRSLIKQN